MNLHFRSLHGNDIDRMDLSTPTGDVSYYNVTVTGEDAKSIYIECDLVTGGGASRERLRVLKRLITVVHLSAQQHWTDSSIELPWEVSK